MTTQVDIARRLGLDVSSVNKILNRCAGPVFRKETVRKVFKAAKDLGYDFARIKFRHRRSHARRPVKIHAMVSVFNRNGALYDQGPATISELSAGGAQLQDVALPMGTIPLEPFTLAIRPVARPWNTVTLPARIVRVLMEDGVGFGVRFEPLDGPAKEKLERMMAG